MLYGDDKENVLFVAFVQDGVPVYMNKKPKFKLGSQWVGLDSFVDDKSTALVFIRDNKYYKESSQRLSYEEFIAFTENELRKDDGIPAFLSWLLAEDMKVEISFEKAFSKEQRQKNLHDE